MARMFPRLNHTTFAAIALSMVLSAIPLFLGARGLASEPVLILEDVQVEGTTRTQAETLRGWLPLEPGSSLDVGALFEAADDLRASLLFGEVSVHTKPGSAPGRVVAVFKIKDPGVQVRFGAGHEDLSGWYLIPAQLHWGNPTGSGDRLDLSARVGYRLSGLVLRYRSTPEFVRRPYWEARASLEHQERIFFLDETEVNQTVPRGGIDATFGVPVAEHGFARITLAFETVEPDSEAVVYRDRKILGRNQGDLIPFEDLPAGIQTDLGKRNQTRFGVAAGVDRRRGAGLETRGVRGLLRAEGVLSGPAEFLRLEGEARGVAPVVPGLQLAARLRGGAVGSEAPFYERYYLGGLYTVRGFPSQSLSPPRGDRLLTIASLELRSRWLGPASAPRLTGHLFADLGWSGNESLRLADTAAGIGYGIRWRLPWVGLVGVDVGAPITDSPFDDSFHVNVSLGWAY